MPPKRKARADADAADGLEGAHAAPPASATAPASTSTSTDAHDAAPRPAEDTPATTTTTTTTTTTPAAAEPVDSLSKATAPTVDVRAAKRIHLSTESALSALPLPVLQRHLPAQRDRCLAILSGRLPPVPTADDGSLEPPGSECIGHGEEWLHLYTMLNASVTAREGNSCLLIGSSGAGKSMLLDSVLRKISHDARPAAPAKTTAATVQSRHYYRVHLTGSIQTTDRSAMKEMAQQLISQGAFRDEDIRDEIDDQLNEPESGAGEAEGDAEHHDGDDDGDGDHGEADDHVFGGGPDDDDDDDGGGEGYDADAAEEENVVAGAILSSLSNIISHIISLLSTSSRAAGASTRKPLVVSLDDFDLFTARPRQALLYCLLDAVQAGSYGAGLAVVGLTSRVDTVDLLEKRVKSRFSHRIIHVRPPASLDVFQQVARRALLGGRGGGGGDAQDAPLTSEQRQDDDDAAAAAAERRLFLSSWTRDVDALLTHPSYAEILRALYDLTNDIRLLYRTLFPPLAALSPTANGAVFPIATFLQAASDAVSDGMGRTTLPALTEHEYALLVAAKHVQTRDRTVFNFEMCLDELRRFAGRQSRSSKARSLLTAAPGIEGTVADRRTAFLAFQSLVASEIFLVDSAVASLDIKGPASSGAGTAGGAAAGGGGGGAARGGRAGIATGVGQEFVKVRCILDPADIVRIVKEREKVGGLPAGLVKWVGSSV
ncbi:uncharacterized protein PFL1_03503 [Pseudozyma flocculosa PF-1]|uniref:Related to Origin recognition complex subunit 4 n=2 Tax=Pseudozyma flocculosa TaxID=84751 RepID=A0A5C3FAP6_9BASI|nr:uncharacterized protein PFL1_03503 [Pseudozyma flocculosa PF-1]EPQ29216.1 hypothetical protein PFL1_03503 [Pseudozyma flocculosa PF-1]SPO41482.1 related to Origin recognition complex subunit 4 [Pseudozyma flocculosa]